MMMLHRVVPGLALAAALMGPGQLAAQVAPTGPDTVVYEARRGNVTFTHRKHAELAECSSCHHASKEEKPLEYEYQKCSACHLEPAQAPVTTNLRAAFHDTVNRTGVCYDCHKTEAAAGKSVPVQCAECHRRDGAQRPKP
jgi:hypothetical protein